jgi:metal-responsive CopG/Arc/MetJ family transcriptional regulator
MKTHSTKLSEDLSKRVEDYVDNHGASKSEALRELIKMGVDLPDSTLERIDQYADEQGLSRPEAMHELLRSTVDIPEDVDEGIAQYADEQGQNRTEATRELLRVGVHNYRHPHTFSLAIYLLWLGSLLHVAAFLEMGTNAGIIGTVMMGVGVLLHSSKAVGWLRSLRASLAREVAALREQGSRD